jgi:hypothetical protein
MSVHRCKASFWTSHGQPMVAYEVLVDGVKYRCNERELDRLYAGIDPADLDLVEITDSDEDSEAAERAEHFIASRP